MSIWQRILAGAQRFAESGPVTNLIAAFTQGPAEDDPRGVQNIAFTIGVIALAAKMAKADGVVTADEVDAFHEVFAFPPNEAENVARVFNLARKDTAGFEGYARQIHNLFQEKPKVLEDLLHCLFHIAKADGVVHPSELGYLGKIAKIFGFDENDFLRIRMYHMAPDQHDPYVILGVAPDVDDMTLRQTYLRLVRDYHPDRMIADGVPEEFAQSAGQKLAVINDAYERIILLRRPANANSNVAG